MNNDLKDEMRLRAMRLRSYDEHKHAMLSIVDKLVALSVQEYETVKGLRRKITSARRRAKAKKIIDTLPAIDVTADVQAQVDYLARQNAKRN